MRNHFSSYLLCLLAIALTACSKPKVQTQLVGLPHKPNLTQTGRNLIIEFEVGGKSGYNPHPEWPGFQSGVTEGCGYDNGYNTREVILTDWTKLTGKERLADTSGLKGAAAKARLSQVKDILVKWDLALEVFDNTTVTKFWQLCQRTFPGFDDLQPDAQAGILSLVFNRGNSLAGPRREEMREIKNLIPKKDYKGIAYQIRHMKRIWDGTDIEKGMTRRREAEAKLIESCGK